MDIWQLAVFTAVSACIPKIASILAVFIVYIATSRTTVHNPEQVAQIDSRTTSHHSSVRFSGKRVPSAGWHFLQIGWTIAVAQKTFSENQYSGEPAESWNIWTIRGTRAERTFRDLFTAGGTTAGGCTVITCSGMRHGWGTRATIRYPLACASDVQRIVARTVASWYSPQESLAIALHGTPGSGKSWTPYIIAAMLRGVAIDGYLPTDNALSFINILNICNTRPLVIVINEFDSAIRKATAESKEDRMCDARDKASLLRMMDCIGSSPGVIAVYTMNCSLEDLVQTYGEKAARPYLRRFRKVWKFTDVWNGEGDSPGGVGRFAS